MMSGLKLELTGLEELSNMENVKNNDFAEEIKTEYQIIVDELRFIKKQQFVVTNYIITLFVVIDIIFTKKLLYAN